ncbi:type IV secretory pathway TraG/TraD family ATPase VirD4 [Saccharopolyspora lacisalsi]|uniref:Type IV secretory pathway TraG/TraD family ATPase VirD4 n=1 Tax=Halosaccharopolyspora lacisalsi TaxID=1000566 RepID=A0A839EAB7_9PSEU|nr:type IV secretory system conjugative DNA transfer family protein [Halosaccharopolyspora lacisalsi]MBA8827788.1 type IV secretory pathway TraG/TraD family ATPase VirD4 [Halosaccharopolyspora lacisalsi]
MSGAAPASNEKTTLAIAGSVLAAAVAAYADIWVATGLCGLLATGSWARPGMAVPQLVETLTTVGPAGLVPGVSPVLFWVLVAVLAIAELVGGVLGGLALADRLAGGHDPARLARKRDLGDLTGKQAAQKARGLRPSLQHAQELGRDVGIRLMQVAGMDVYMSWEDVALILMGPRSNKTSAIAVPTILSANGPVVVTSNKTDVWALTRSLRAQAGRVFTFDPQQIAYVDQTWYWDPIAAIRQTPQHRQLEAASRLTAHFTGTISGERADPFFSQAAERVLSGSILAAAANPDGTFRDVLRYLRDQRRDAVDALDNHGATVDAEELESTLGGADVTTEGIYETARTAVKCLRSEALLRWVTPPSTWSSPPEHELASFDPWELVAGGADTVYLLSKEGGSSSAPVVTALVDRITEVAEYAAQARGGRLDPSLVLMLDEAANICPLSSLPSQYSHWGSRGIQALTILQSYKQGARVWGREGMDSLWSAATVKIAGAGLDDVDFLGWLSQLIGEHWVRQPVSVSTSSSGRSDQYSATKESIMPVARLRALAKTEALLINPGRPVAHGTLLPWYRESEQADDISAAGDASVQQVQHAAAAYLGPDNPVAARLNRGDDSP